ncbi:MAG: YcaO-like family protein [Actinomycetes bacterium]
MTQPAFPAVSSSLAVVGDVFSAQEVETAAAGVCGDPGTARRTTGASDSIEKIEPYLIDYGITRVAHVTHLDRVGIPVHTALKPFGTSLSNGSGKGLTEEASKIGAMMEAIEQTYWEESTVEAIEMTQNDLARNGVLAVNGDNLARIKGSIWNHDLPVHWAPMYDLVSGEEMFVPTEAFEIAKPRLGIPTFMISTNGLASGNNVFEAILSGLTEVIERDAVAMFTVGGAGQTFADALDLDQLATSFGSPFIDLRETIDRADLQLMVFDATHELEVPTYRAFVHDLGVSRAGVFGGYGTNLDPAVALCRAVTEAVQSRGLIISGSRDDQFGSGRDASLLHSNHYAAPDPGAQPVTVRPDRTGKSILEDIELLTALLAGAGMDQVMIHRYSDESDPAQVVRVTVPGLEGYRFPYYSPGPRAQRALAAMEGDNRE